MRWAALVGVLVGSLAAPALAQDAWLVTEVAIGEPSPQAARIVRDTERELRARGLKVVESSAAAALFERKHSRAAYAPKPGEIEALEQLSRRLTDALAAEDVAQVQSLLSELEGRPADAQDLLNRDTLRARRRFQNCLSAAQLFDRRGQARPAQEQLSACARDFPGVPLELAANAPEGAGEFLANARRSFAASPASSLRIEAEPSRDKTRCFVRVDGVARGNAPVTLDQLRTPRVRVQLECGDKPSRIYEPGLAQAQNTLRIDPNLDAAVVTQRGLGLHYVDAASADALRLKHGVVLAEAAGARQLLQLFRGKLRRVDVATGRELSSDAADGGAPLAAAVDFVLSNGENPLPVQAARRPAPPAAIERSPAPAAESHGSAAALSREPAPIPIERESISDPRRPEVEPPEIQPQHRYRGPPARPFLTLGYVAAGLTVAAAATAIVFWRVREGHVDKFNQRPECTDADPGDLAAGCQKELDAADSAGSILLIAAISGGSALVLTGTFLIIDANRPRERYRDLSCAPGPGSVGISCGLHF